MNDHETASPGLPGPVAPVPTNWFMARPVPVYLIAALCMFQMGVIAYLTIAGWDDIQFAFVTGARSPLQFLIGYLFPLLHLAAAILLLLMRKSAAYAFSAYFLWSVARLGGPVRFPTAILDLLLTSCIVAYCWWLYRQGRLV